MAAAVPVAARASAGGSGGSTGTSSASGARAAPRSSPATLNGAGSTLAQPIYQQWGSNLKSQGLTVNYNGVGSGTGIADLQTATVDFAGSDPALKAEDKKGMKGPVLQFPVAFGAITVSYNLPGVKSGLKLDGPTLANIFSGKIKTWNDPAIKALNSGMSLPSTAITVVHRSDSSGTTNGFTTYLSDVSPSWKSSIGAGKDVKWPVGTGAAKNSGVAAAVKQTAGAVGYVEQAYALENGFTYAAIKNGSTYVAADDREHLGGGQRDHGPGRPRHLDDQLVDRRAPTRSCPRRSSSSTRTRARTTRRARDGQGPEVVPGLRVRRRAADARLGATSCPTRRCPRPSRPRTTRSWPP